VFVTEGVEQALRLAQAAAGDRNVAVSGTTIVQQLLKAGLIDEILIDLAPILLGAGTRLFDHLGIDPVDLEKIAVIDAPRVTHLKYRVVK
jgi:dihydrofolate reductase